MDSSVQIGQVWEDNDPRRQGDTPRQVRIEAIDGKHALVKNLSTRRTTRVLLKRFRPVNSGYKLVEGTAQTQFPTVGTQFHEAFAS